MLKSIAYFIIVLLAGLSIYYYIDAQNARIRLEERSALYEQALEAARDQCEERVARLKYDYEKKLAAAGQAAPPAKLVGKALFNLVEEQRLKARRQTLDELSTALNLDEGQIQAVTALLDGFEAGKKNLLATYLSEGGRPFDPAFMARLNDLREETLAQMGRLLSADQNQVFLNLELDRRLDLRRKP